MHESLPRPSGAARRSSQGRRCERGRPPRPPTRPLAHDHESDLAYIIDALYRHRRDGCFGGRCHARCGDTAHRRAQAEEILPRSFPGDLQWKTPLLRDPAPRRSLFRRREHSGDGLGFNSYRRIQCAYDISPGEPFTRIRAGLRASHGLVASWSSFRSTRP